MFIILTRAISIQFVITPKLIRWSICVADKRVLILGSFCIYLDFVVGDAKLARNVFHVLRIWIGILVKDAH